MSTTFDIGDAIGIIAILLLMTLLHLVTEALARATIEDAIQQQRQQEAEAQAEQARPPATAPASEMPAGTLIEIGDAAFTSEEASRIASLRDYWQGSYTSLPWRNGGAR